MGSIKEFVRHMFSGLRLFNLSAPTVIEVLPSPQQGSTPVIIFGDSGTDGSWGMVQAGDNLNLVRRESGSWVTKGHIHAVRRFVYIVMSHCEAKVGFAIT